MAGGLASGGVGVSLLYLSPSLVATVCSFAVAVHFLDRSRAHDAMRAFALALLAEALWSAGILGELAAVTLGTKVFWDSLQLPFVFLTALAIFEFARRYVGRPPIRGPRAIAALAALPLAATLFVLADPVHHLARSGAHVADRPPFGSLVYPFTTIELVAFLYVVGLLVAANVLMIRELARQSAEFRFQTAILTIACALPLVLPILVGSGVEVLGQRDAAPLVFGANAVLVAFALSRRSTFELLPIARDAVFENIPDGVLVVDEGDRIVDANPSARALLGGEIVRRTLADVLPELESSLRHVLERDSVVQVTVERGGHERAFDARLATFRAAGSTTSGRVLVLTDVSARTRAEREARHARDHLESRVAERTADLARVNDALSREVEERAATQAALLESEQRFRAVFEQTFQFIGVLALDGTLERANLTALEFIDAPASEIEGRPFWDTAYWSHSPELQDRLRTAIREAAAGRVVRFEATHPDRLGVEHVIDFSIKPIVGVDGAPLRLVAEGRDVTENRRMAEARVQLEVQLHQAQKMESLGRLAGGVAHDFNNLLTAIVGNASLILRKTEADGLAATFAKDILRAGESAAELTKQLLAFSRRQMIQRRPEDVGELVERSVRLLSRVVGDDVELVTELRATGVRANVDAGQIEQAIVNLAVNARDAMPEGGRLTITVDLARPSAAERERLGLARADDEWVTLAVSDVGSGMSDEVRARIFEPFFTTKPLGRGTGLGLAMVFGAMRQNEGGVDVRSAPGEGTTFTLYFPRTFATPSASRRSSVGVPRGAEHVVVVEDQPLVRDLTARWLLELGYRVRSFASADEAIAGLGPDQPIDLLLTDVVLPGMSGRLLAERLTAERPGIRVLFMSGYNDDVALERSGSVSGIAILSKPFTVEQLANAVRFRLLPVSGEHRLDPDPPAVRPPPNDVERREDTGSG